MLMIYYDTSLVRIQWGCSKVVYPFIRFSSEFPVDTMSGSEWVIMDLRYLPCLWVSILGIPFSFVSIQGTVSVLW
jgi:hypothetical protein